MSAARFDRRQFLALTGAALSAAPFHALACRAIESEERGSDAFDPSRPDVGYGPLHTVNDDATGLPLLHLPAGFRYHTFGWTGDPLVDGSPTPGAHDGMAAFPADGDRIRLVRNHELRRGPAFADRSVYDRNAGGGTTTIEFDTSTGALISAWPSLAGTAVNCAGGPTPWGSWLSCEETFEDPGGDNDYLRPHGYVFEVPADGTASAEPLRAMGRFRHEAVAVDSQTGIVYETEDTGAAGFYRFLPAKPGNLAAGGRLEMLALDDTPRADTRSGQTSGVWRRVHWVPIDDPDPREITRDAVFVQGSAGGGATFGRLEGTWYANGRIFIVSTNGGDAEEGQVWEYAPAEERLRLIFESPSAHVLHMPDNLCVSPRGGLVLCEDGGTGTFGDAPERVQGLTVDGAVFPLAMNNVVLAGEKNGMEGDYRNREFAGATFSPDGRWLFLNVQSPGITIAVTGAWSDGPL